MKRALVALSSLMLVLAGVAAALWMWNAAPVSPPIPAAEAANPTKPFVVKLHAQWCHVCLATTSMWSQVESSYGNRVNLVVFDFTNEATTVASEAEARRLGLEKFFAETEGTGSVAVLHGRTKEVLAFIAGSRDFSEYRAAIDQALTAMKAAGD